MNEQKLKGLLGLALRAGQVSAGTDACRIQVRSGKCGLLLLDGTAGIHTRKKAEELCGKTGTQVKILPPGMIESATGRTNMLLGISKGSFSDQICMELMTENEAPD